MSQSFADEQASNAMLRRRMLEEKQKAESARASEYLTQFVESAKEQGLPTEPLIVRGYGGKGTAKTPLVGWYLKNDRSMAVDVDGNFYLQGQAHWGDSEALCTTADFGRGWSRWGIH